MSQHVVISRRAAVYEVRLSRPEKRNALTLEMYAGLLEALAAAEADREVRVILLSGEGACFTAGNDLKDFMDGSVLTDPQHATTRFLRALPGLSKVLIAAVHGPTAGIGVTLLLHCDLVVAARSTRLILPFVQLGLVPEAASTLLLPRLIGRRRAAEALLLGEPLAAATAKDWGLVNRVVEDEALMEHSRALADAIARQPPAALEATKRLLCQSERAEIAARMEEELEEFSARLGSAEFKAASRAFFAGRRGT
jgi:enoyl-CoA hydratase/carnithine racemase